MLNFETMTMEQLYNLKEAYYEQLMINGDSINVERIMTIINEISIEMKKRRNG